MRIKSQGKGGESPISGLAGALKTCTRSGLVLVDLANSVAQVNPAAARYLGLGTGTRTVALPVLPDSLRASAHAAASHPTGETWSEMTFATGASGTLGVFASRFDLPGAGTGVVLVLHDLNTLERLQRTVEQLDRLASLGTLSAGMAHEIKNSLVPLRTHVGLMLEKQPGEELASTVLRETERLDSMVARVLRFAGAPAAVLRRIEMRELIEESLRLVEPHLEGRSIQVVRDLSAEPLAVLGDALQLQQALVNLLLNASEAMAWQGTLTVSTGLLQASAGAASQETVKRLFVRLQDTGKGIPDENLSHLFDPFFTTKPNGTGLGLAITRRIILDHHGEIEVQSEVNKGSAFTVVLPMAV